MKAAAQRNTRRHRVVNGLLILVAILAATVPSAAECADWFGGTGRAAPLLLAAPKETGLQSRWGYTDNDESIWDFDIGSDISVWQTGSSNDAITISARFMIHSRFQFNSASFNLWGSDFCGGLVAGRQWAEKYTGELFLYHESSHLGDETMDQGIRKRIDCSLNGIRVLGFRTWQRGLTTYAGMSLQGVAEPSDIRGVGIHLGAQMTDLPPGGRGFLAMNSEWWDWRDWNPDVCLQAGVTLGSQCNPATQRAARLFLQVYSGRVQMWQFWDETETSISIGMAHNW